MCVCIVYHKMRSKYQDKLKSSKWPKTSVILGQILAMVLAADRLR